MLHLLSTGEWMATAPAHLYHSRKLYVLRTIVVIASLWRRAKAWGTFIPVVLPISYVYASCPDLFTIGLVTIVT